MFKKTIDTLAHHTGRYIKALMPDSINEPLTLDAYNTLMERYLMTDFLSYGHADDENDCIWLDDNPTGVNSILLCYQVSPLIIAGRKATYKLEKLINRMPEGTVISSFAFANNDIEGYLENWAMSRRNSPSAIFDLFTKRRVKYMIEWANGKIQPMSRGVSFKPRLLQYFLFIRVPATYQSYTQENITSFLSEIDQIHSTVVSQMTTAKMPVKRLKGSEMAIVIKNFINLHIPAKHNREDGINTNQSLAMQMIPSTTKHMIDKEGDIYITDEKNHTEKYLSVMNVNKYSDEPHFLSETQKCIGSMIESNDFIPGEFYAYTIIEKQSATKRIKDIGTKLGIVNWHTSVQSEMFQNLFRHHHQLKRIIYDFIDDVKNGIEPVKVISGIVIAADSKSALKNACAHADTSWKAAGLTLKKETSIALPAWLASLPGMYIPAMDGVDQGLQRGVTMKAINAATLMHVQGDWMGSHPLSGGLLLLSRRGMPAVLNVFETFKANFNALIAATSGSGKSFLMADLITDFITREGFVRVLDMGRSYYETVERTGGQNVICERESKLCFNIFSTMTTREILDESLAMLSRLVAQMCFPSGYADTDQVGQKYWEESFIADMITEIWETKSHKMSMVDLYEYCNLHRNEDPRIKDMVMLLKKWAKGHYAKWVVGDWNIDFSNRFIVFELDELKKDPELQNVILNLLISRIADEMYYSWLDDLKNKGKISPKLLCIDEAWYLLARPNGARFVEELARRLRKYYGSIIIITQSFMDMNVNSAAHAFIENSNWIISLLQDIGTIKKAIKEGLIDFKDYALEILDSLHKTNDYSELYVLNKSVKGEGVYRLVVDPISYWTYTTDGNDKNKIEELMKSGLTRFDAIKQLAGITDDK